MRRNGAAVLWCYLLGLLLSGAAGSAARAATLRWKFQPGETLHYVMDQKTVTAVKAATQDVKTTATQTIDLEWAVKGVAEDGRAELTQRITRLRTRIESSFGTFEYDSKSEKEPQGPIAGALVPLLKAMVGAPFSFKMNPQGELSDVKVPAQVTEALTKAGPAGGAGMFSEEGLKNMIRESSLALPKDDLAEGKTWTRTTKVPTPMVGTMIFDKTFRYLGPDPKAGPGVERIALETKVDMQTAPESKIDLKITSQEGKGSFLFDNTAGRVTESRVGEKIDTTITIKDQDKSQSIVQSNDTTTTMTLIKTDRPEPAK